ncbi:MAG: plastocyanin/azurin family copper binding protein [uncultured bacterium]|uniref:EfeO-type cupredoxin-like domain-containing protein n=2 Tax=Candidatus Daviesiibacteriota TaxID=1752718 RepID=A0A1F5K5X5_9BACT|nr:MAG: plastocyanin/azurin family copper binding protein [uncultured bacterium]KKQ15177.1 MAG: hypothetical protein US28_C0021G0008 [Candidatus Daviesbacteria bacterium GW2011_GWA1_36_8]OGE36224.1 MAG: hypothetical protein A3E66_05470 [Candidatus Daviesbacteria bacterium RIFCSPHIGHO2_12_FULL_37_16]
MNSRNLIIAIVVIVLLGAGGWYFLNSQNAQSPQDPAPTLTPQSMTQDEQAPSTDSSQTASEAAVKITSSGFEPQTITIKAGETLTWTNSDTADHTVNSAVHPTHQVYPPLNVGNIPQGGSKSLMFPDKGTYKYHDHLNPTLFGTVAVE